MKVKDLLEELRKQQMEYGKSFLNWDVYTEQITEADKAYKRKRRPKGQGWKHIKDGEDWEYFECAGFWTKFPEKKIFTININY
jgi:hypothetical protein